MATIAGTGALSAGTQSLIILRQPGHCASAFASSGRAACLPLSTSVELADQLPGTVVEVVAHDAKKLTQELPQQLKWGNDPPARRYR